MPCFCFSSAKKALSSTQRTNDEVPDVSDVHNVKVYSYREMQNATENFNPANKIGEGGFGSVFKGRLRDGTMVAVKVLSPESRQGLREFLTELVVIADVDHENLVKVYGCCVERNNRILVYDYLENNSLAQTLLGGSHNVVNFTWRIRKNISIGIARGLAYLHEEVRPHIIHRDIKASNILLDKDFNAKISDFGLAKLIPPNMTHVSTRIAGTLGYLAPEYGIRGQLTRKADVYSFGVLLLEIVCGTCNRNKRLPSEDQYLLERAWRMYESGQVVELVDESLRGDLNIVEACTFMKIALLCTQDVAKTRPSMSNVVKMLQGKVDISNIKTRKPGLLNELANLKISGNPNDKLDMKNNTSYPLSPSSAKPGTSSASDSSNPTFATMTITSISDRTC
ncbi:Cold-responsive protein kinase 1 [Ancistrocladus abbreviatus]